MTAATAAGSTGDLPCQSASSRRARLGCVIPELQTVQIGVVTTGREQFGMTAGFDDLSFGHDDDPVSTFDRREAMGNDKGRAVLHQVRKRCLDPSLGLRIERRGCLIENQDRRILEQRPRNGDALALATGEQHAPVTDPGIEPVGQLVGELIDIGGTRSCLDIRTRRVPAAAVGDIAGNRVVEQHHFLADQADLVAQR